MRIKPRWLLILLVMGLVLAACSPSGSDTTTTEGAAATTEGATDTTEAMTDTTEGGAAIATDVGVDLDAGTITVGLLSDLTGPFGALVTPIVTGHEVYWENVNAAGGINGLEVRLETRDTQYVVDNHVQLYEELKDQVVAFGHSTGSPHTVAINEALQTDGILAIPLTWYSGWSDTALNANLLHHGAPYCIEAQNSIGWLKDQMGDGIQTIAIVTFPGDYGLDSAAGAALAAEALGLEVVVDMAGAIIPTDEATITAAADAIAANSPDLVWATVNPTVFSSIFGQALAAGYSGTWSGAAPSYSPAFVAPDSPIKDAVAASMYFGIYFEPWDGSSPGTEAAKQMLADSGRDISPFDYYLEGFVEAQILHEALLVAYANGDLTQAGVLAAAKSIDNLTFDGLAPDETFVGTSNEQVQRAQWILKPDPEGLASGTNGGTQIVEANYTSDIAAAFEFNEACYQLG